jgi:MFS family permease
MSNSTPAPAPSGWSSVGRALRHRNFRLYFGGQGLSLLGTWMQQVAQGWLVYRLTGRMDLMGLVTFASQIPSFLLLPLVGVVLDRWDRHRLVVTTQALAMAQALLLAVLTLTGLLALWQLVVLAIFLGCVNAFDLPARQAFLPALVPDRADLGNAIALHSSIYNGARLLGPALAGWLLELSAPGTGEGICFLLNGLSFLAVLLALLSINVASRPQEASPAPVFAGLTEGVQYVMKAAPIRTIVLFVGWIGFIGMPYMLLLPVFADQVLGGGAETYGLLMTASGVGALCGAIFLATRHPHSAARTRIVATCTLLGAALISLSLVREIYLAIPLLMLIGSGMMLTMVSCNTIVQTLVPDEKRGRVMSLYNLAFMGMTPFGCLLAGGLAEELGATATLLICGGGCLLGAVCFACTLGLRSEPMAEPEGTQTVVTPEE